MKTAATFVRGETCNPLSTQGLKVKRVPRFKSPSLFPGCFFVVVVLKKPPGLCPCSAGGVSLPAGFAARMPGGRGRRVKDPAHARHVPLFAPLASPKAWAKARWGCGSHPVGFYSESNVTFAMSAAEGWITAFNGGSPLSA